MAGCCKEGCCGGGCCGRHVNFSCNTGGNKIVWTLFIIAMLLGIGTIVGGAVPGNRCFAGYKRCVERGQFSAYECFERLSERCDLQVWTALVVFGCAMIGVICPFLLLWFCCCQGSRAAAYKNNKGAGSSDAVPAYSNSVPLSHSASGSKFSGPAQPAIVSSMRRDVV